MSMDDRTILDRIAKLLALAKDSGATEAEAATALQKAHEILASHNLTMDEVDKNEKEKREESRPTDEYVVVGKWDVQMFTDLARHNYCFVLRTSRFNMILIGKPVNVQATKIMFSWVREQVERFWRQEWEQDPRYCIMNWRTHKAGFMRGITVRIWSRLEAQKRVEEASVQTMAMVRVDEAQQYAKEKFDYREATKREERKYDLLAMATGYKRGDDVKFVGDELPDRREVKALGR